MTRSYHKSHDGQVFTRKPVAVHTTKKGNFLACSQKPSCHFFCSKKESFLYERAVASWESTAPVDLPKCPTHLMNAKMIVVKDLTKETYGRPYFVFANKSMPCAFWMWGDVQPNPPCHHGYPSKQRKVHKEGSNKGHSFLNCPISPQCQYFKWMD